MTKNFSDLGPAFCPVQLKVPTGPVDFPSQLPEIKRLTVYKRNMNFRIALLHMIHGKLFQEVELGPGSGFELIESLQPCLESEYFCLQSERHIPSLWRHNFAHSIFFALLSDRFDVSHRVCEFFRGGIKRRTIF